MGEAHYQASGRVDVLKQRAGRCCCKFCGGKLVVRRIIFSEDEDARIELFAASVIVLSMEWNLRYIKMQFILWIV